MLLNPFPAFPIKDFAAQKFSSIQDKFYCKAFVEII